MSPTCTLAIVGNLNIDLWVQPVEGFPAVDEERLVDSVRVAVAGTAGYMLEAAAAIGTEAMVVSTIGDDTFGETITGTVARLTGGRAGVETLDGEETPISMVFIGPDGGRSIISTLGAHRRMGMDVVARHDARISACAEVVLCGTYLLPELGPTQILPFARSARERGQLVAFDPSWDPGGWGERVRQDTFALLAHVDVYLPNEEELTHLTGAPDWRAGVEAVAGRVPEIAVKRGGEGASVIAGGEWVDVPAFEVDARNTIGAGDTFDVGYLHARRQGWSPRSRLEFAGALAALVVSQPGVRCYPTLTEVLAFLQDRLGDAWGPDGPTPNTLNEV